MQAEQHNRLDFIGFDISNVAAGPRRDRPWLLPSNRKLRHLQGISLRNLTLSSQRSRPRGKTIDDESLPQTWKSPAKLLAQRESHQLGHSRSSNDLSSYLAKSAEPVAAVESREDEQPETRPSFGKARRRSTLSWSGNPDFRFFDLKDYGAAVTRRDRLIVKFWAKSERMQEYQYLLEHQVHLRSMQFMGKSVGSFPIEAVCQHPTDQTKLEKFHHPLPQNCIIFYLSDGVYANLTDIPPHDPPLLLSLHPPKSLASGDVKSTSSYDALMRLSTLDDCIQDALAIRSNIAGQINSLIESHQPSLQAAPHASQARESLSSTKRALASEKKLLKGAIKTRANLRTSLKARREAMEQGRRAQARAQDYLDEAATKLKKCEQLLRQTKEELRGQQRRIVEDLMRIYPVEPVPNRPLQFTIANLPLANSTFFDPSTTSTEATTAVALGHVTHILHLLSFYLSVPLPYPLQPHSSTSTIHDPISLFPHTTAPSTTSSRSSSSSSSSSLVAPSRIFSLFPGRASIPYRFEYGVFLLNKDLERLMAAKGLKVLDLRQTLPNLKYLIEVVRGGGGGVPDRKRGGVVRGLGGLPGLPGVENDREASDDAGLSESGDVVSSQRGVDHTRKVHGMNETAPAPTPTLAKGTLNGSKRKGETSSSSARALSDAIRDPAHEPESRSDPMAENGDRARELVERDAEGLVGRLKRQAAVS
ncbi:MAG: hypothetical protein M1837_002982 [Sclerophora amabilis]|nr:MAG: hypothetical protein M1837_002982 [Sclerophora amabilis]